MTVLQQILEWSQNRPMWQRDALRRLVINGDLSNDDFQSLTKICKMAHNLAESQEVAPLEKEHIPNKGDGSVPVSLESISHHRGVNALAERQTIKFGPNLTLVYGDNAAGKTGYIRILKNACRTRGQEAILGNVLDATSPTPSVSIKYKVGNETVSREWTGTSEDEFISRVSVFDTQCAAVYLTKKTDVAFRPFGLDLFDKLVQACKTVREYLKHEQRTLSSDLLVPIQNHILEGTTTAELLKSFTSKTLPETVYKLTRMSADEEARLTSLEQSLLDLQGNDPEKLILQLTLRIERVRALASHIEKVEKLLSTEAVQEIFNTRDNDRRKNEEAEERHKTAFPPDMLDGTGSESWILLWEAARKFSEEIAYPDQSFPVVEDKTQCVLCQQSLNPESRHRLQRFEDFFNSTIENELRRTREIFMQQRKEFTDLNVSTEAVSETLDELRIEYKSVAVSVATALGIAENRRQAVLSALSEDLDLAPDCPDVQSVAEEVNTLEKEITERRDALREGIDNETHKKMTTEVRELRARKFLAQHEQLILDEIDRKKKYTAYDLCIKDTNTPAITKKSADVTRGIVTQKLQQSFQDELSTLKFHHTAKVELKAVGGEEGALYHKLVLTHAHEKTELPKVASEGEQRCISIAAFFTELSTADDSSGIVFDDPVSSLDYKWRKNVAKRLVEAAKDRQVIVFTHDVVFLLQLKRFAQEQSVDQFDQHVRQLPMGAGMCEEELPWVALTVKKKIGYLKNEWQAANKLFHDKEISAYEEKAIHLYGLLREAWERGVEEVLLNGVVERYRPNIQTLHIGTIADICPEDCATLDAAMSKCSELLPGHDQAAAARAPVPEPPDLEADIEELHEWVSTIRKRRETKRKTAPA